MSAISPEKEKNPEVTAEAEKKAEETKGSPGKKTAEYELKLKEAMGNLAAGKRNLLINDISGAVSSFAEACKMMGELYGETAAECGEAFFYYGKALLEMARMENGVLENGLGGVPEGDDKECSGIEDPEKMSEEEKEDVANKVGEAIEEMNKEAEKEKAAADLLKKDAAEREAKDKAKADDKKEGDDKAKEGDKDEAKKDESSENGSAEDEGEEAGGEEASAEGKEGEEEEKAEGEDGEDEEAEGEAEGGENESIGSNDAGPSTAKETEDKSAVEAEDDDDPSSLQLSWEMLELAKQCLKKQADALPADDPKRPEVEGRLSETFMKLGEVSIENENYPQAVEDLKTCLRRHQEHLPDDSRCIAEAHYQIGVALGFNLEFDSAVASLEDAIGVLEKRVKNLKEKKASANPDKKEDAFYTPEKEVEEIESLIPEIREKITDTRDMQTETNKKLGDKVLAEEKEMEAISAPAAESSSPTKKSANGVGVKSTSNGINGAAADGDKKDTNGATNDISHMVKKRKKSDPAEGGVEAKKTKEAESNGTAAEAKSSA